jgi:hypothetical protein
MCGSPLLRDCDVTANLAQTPSAYTHVLLAFAKPDFAWNGANWDGRDRKSVV